MILTVMFAYISLQANVALCSPLEKPDEDLISPLMADVEVEIVKELERDRERDSIAKGKRVCTSCVSACLSRVRADNLCEVL